MFDHNAIRLGRKAVIIDSRTPSIRKYLTPALAPAPAARDWSGGLADYGMMLNDRLGDCTIALCGHAVQTWSLASVKLELTVPDAVIEGAYSKWCGYVPGKERTDQGGILNNVFTDWKRDTLGGHALLGFTSANFQDLDELRQAINLFGGIGGGVNLALAQQQQEVWDYSTYPTGKPGTWGGHAIWIPKYNADGTFECITWGKLQRMTAQFLLNQMDEAFVPLGVPFLTAMGNPDGVNMNQLQTDLTSIR